MVSAIQITPRRKKGDLMPYQYRVTWSIDVLAESPIEAMQEARQAQLSQYPVQPFFTVQETIFGNPVFSPFTLDVETSKLVDVDQPELPFGT